MQSKKKNAKKNAGRKKPQERNESIKTGGKVREKALLTEKELNSPYYINFFRKLKDYLFNELFFDSNSKVLLGVSGGADSMAMLDAFANLTRELPGMSLSIAHFNHKLRGEESEGDKELVTDAARKYNLPIFVSGSNVKLMAEQKGLSLEAAARILRYRFFERVIKRKNIEYLITAHNADDTVETFFLNLFRGSGITGLAGIPHKRHLVKDAAIVRPFLIFRKKELTEYCRKRKIQWREDSSNASTAFKRNKIRHELLPLIEKDFCPAIFSVVSRTQKFLRQIDDYIYFDVREAVQKLVFNKSKSRFSIRLSVLKTYDDFLQGEIIQSLLKNNFDIPGASLNLIERVLALEESSVGSYVEINKKYLVLRDRDSLIFSKKNESFDAYEAIEKEGAFKVGDYTLSLKKVGKKSVKITDNPNIEYFDYDLVPSLLYLRSKKPGDTFQPIGMVGTVKISDYLTNIKMPIIDKKNVLVLASKSDIIWVCGFRASDKFKITDDTEKYLKAEFKKRKDDK